MPADISQIAYKYGAPGSESIRLRSTQLGDGYEERRVDGLNPERREWNVTFIFNTRQELANFIYTLRDLKGSWLYWASPLDLSPTRWVVDSWDMLIESPAYGEVSVQLRNWNGT